MSVSAPQKNFFDLPGEIRNTVTRHLLVPGHIWPKPGSIQGSFTEECTERFEIDISFLGTSKRINTEATKLYYEENTLHLPHSYTIRPPTSNPLTPLEQFPTLRLQNHSLIHHASTHLSIRDLNTAILSKLKNSLQEYFPPSIRGTPNTDAMSARFYSNTLTTNLELLWWANLHALQGWGTLRSLVIHLGSTSVLLTRSSGQGFTTGFPGQGLRNPECDGYCDLDCQECVISKVSQLVRTLGEVIEMEIMRHGWMQTREDIEGVIDGSKAMGIYERPESGV